MGIWTRLITPSEADIAFKFTITTTSANTVFTLPLADYNGVTPIISVDWGDGNINGVTSSTDTNRIHTYSLASTYTISITGKCPAFVVSNNASIRTLIKSIVQWGDVGMMYMNFYGCSSITSFPVAYKGLANMDSFANFMRSTGITSIPPGFFDFSTSATIFTDAFSFTSITSIPTDLFKYNTQATTFNSTFNNCTLLSSYPSTLFDTNINVVNFASTFRNCRALTSPLQFTYNTQVTTFGNIYYMNSTTNSLTGTAPTLWTRSPLPYGVGAFHNCIGLTNYSSIPSYFK
jgi:hypothetical protein